ncbi:centromere protein C isoform X1 [Nymphaea colorata]|nr:centromere protein C isoform X1 [Nymphaea colorata]
MGKVDVSKPERSLVGPVDPFATLPLLYFLPESVKTLELPASSSDLDDIEAVHEFLKSKIRVSDISKQLPLQGNRIVNSAKESRKDATARQPLRETDMNDLSITKCIKHPVAEGKENGYHMQKRRPGFGRKRARFSLKPTSQDVVVTSAQPDFDQLKDPEEFFAAYERQENAEKELRRLMGGNLVDQSSSHCLSESRTRRQGILGKTATYRHSYTAIAVDASKHALAVEQSEVGNSSIPSPRNGYGLSRSASMSVHGIGMNQGMAEDINVLNENGKGTTICAPVESDYDGLVGSLLDACCNPDEGHTFSLLQKSLDMQAIDMHKIQLPKFNRFSLHEIMSSQASTSGEKIRLESNISNFADQTWNSKISEETPKTYHAVPETTCSPVTSPTPPKSPFAAISGFCRHKSQRMSEKDTSHSPFMFNLTKGSSFATQFELEAPSHPGGIQQDQLAILRSPTSKCADKNGSLPSGFSHSKWLEKNTMRTGLTSLTTQADGLAGPEALGQEKNLTASSISELPGQEACSINKNSSGFETVNIACPSDQVSGKNSNLENSIVKQSTSGCAIQHPRSEECKAVSSNNCEDVLRDGLICPASVELGNNSNGSNKVVNPQIGMSSNCITDKNSDLENSTRIQSTPGIQHLALEECDAVNNNDYVNMSNNGLTCSADEGLGENSKWFAKDVNPETGVPCVCIEDSVRGTPNAASTSQEVVDGGKDQMSPPTGACRPQEEHLNEINVSSSPQKETSEAPSMALGRKKSKKTASDRRKSLLGAGTAWKSGVRRSTRIKSRPLEYWKGERFLYGRVHNSLVTVIGVKYSSPVDNSKKQTTLKVKSFVSDEYSHLLALAGSH